MPLINASALPRSTLVFGESGSGKSHYIATQLKGYAKSALKSPAAAPDAKPSVLWMCLDNTAVFDKEPELVNLFDIGIYKDFAAWERDLPKAKNYEVLVIDGLAALMRMCLVSICGDKQPSIQQWGEASKRLHARVREAKDMTPNFFASVLLKSENVAQPGTPPQIVTSFDLNADAIKRLIPEFNMKLYSFSVGQKDADGVKVLYQIQNDTSAALRFSQAKIL